MLILPYTINLPESNKNNQFLGVPAFADHTVDTYLPLPTATITVNLQRKRQNLRSTRHKLKLQLSSYQQDNKMFSIQKRNAECKLFCFATLKDGNKNTLYTNLDEKNQSDHVADTNIYFLPICVQLP